MVFIHVKIYTFLGTAHLPVYILLEHIEYNSLLM